MKLGRNVEVRPLGGGVGCLTMLLVSLFLSVLLTLMLNAFGDQAHEGRAPGLRIRCDGKALTAGATRVPAFREASMLGFLLYLLIIGIVAGFLARLLVPGRDSMSIGATILLGIVGSFVGGFLGWVIFGTDLDDGALQASGIIGSVIGAVIALLVLPGDDESFRRGGLARR